MAGVRPTPVPQSRSSLCPMNPPPVYGNIGSGAKMEARSCQPGRRRAVRPWTFLRSRRENRPPGTGFEPRLPRVRMLQSSMSRLRPCCAGGAGRVLDSEGRPMKLPPRSRMRFALVGLVALAAAVFVPGATLRAQNFGGPWTNLTAGGILPLPPPPPQGDFYQVIFANAKWMVVQNRARASSSRSRPTSSASSWSAGRPISRDLSPQVLVEAIGPEMGSMTIQTNHIDLFVGSDMALVKPGYVSVLPINRPATAIDPTYQRYMNAFDIAAQNTVYTWVYPTSPCQRNPGPDARRGQCGQRDSRSAWVCPAITSSPCSRRPRGSCTVTQVTMGSLSFAKKGDAAFLTPVQGNEVSPKSLRICAGGALQEVSAGPSSSPERCGAGNASGPSEARLIALAASGSGRKVPLGGFAAWRGSAAAPFVLAAERVGVAGLIERQVAVIDFQGQHRERGEEEPALRSGPSGRAGARSGPSSRGRSRRP